MYEWLCNREEYVVLFKEKISLIVIKAIKPKFIISFNYKYIIDEDIIEYMGNRIINLHISYLPYNRGACQVILVLLKIHLKVGTMSRKSTN